jgi:hypothetical protein
MDLLHLALNRAIMNTIWNLRLSTTGGELFGKLSDYKRPKKNFASGSNGTD